MIISKRSKTYFNYSNEDFLMLTTKSNSFGDIDSILSTLNLDIRQLVSIDQIHSNKIIFADKPGYYGDADGVISNVKSKNLLLIRTADCMPLFIYDNVTGYFGLIHAGWKGVVKGIHKVAINEFKKMGCNKNDISVFIGPSIKVCCFEVKDDIINNFNNKFIIKSNNKMYVDLQLLVIDDFIKNGIVKSKISYHNMCTFEENTCCSYRRDGKESGRMYSLMYYKS